MANQYIWSQPVTIAFAVSDLLAYYGAAAANVSDVIITVTPSDGSDQPSWSFQASVDPSNVDWDATNEVATLTINTADFSSKAFSNETLRCHVGLILAGDTLTTYEPQPDQASYNTTLQFVAQGVPNQ